MTQTEIPLSLVGTRRFTAKERKNVRRFIKSFVKQGLRPEEIAKELNKAGSKTANDAQWTAPLVRNQMYRMGMRKRKLARVKRRVSVSPDSIKPRAVFSLPPSLEFMLDDASLTDAQKLKLLRVFKGGNA